MKEEDIPKCENCIFRKKAETRPKSIIGRIWNWHTKWCPGWKAYQKYLSELDA